MGSSTSGIVAIISIVFSGFLGTGGAGYAFVQWWTKRNDLESRANAARILTDAASGIIVELRQENKELNDRIEAQTKKHEAKLDKVYTEFRALKRPVLVLINQINMMLPEFSQRNLEIIKPTLVEIESKL